MHTIGESESEEGEVNEANKQCLSSTGGIDFNASIITGEFGAGDYSRDLDMSLMIFNDNIDEVNEVFAVLLELVSAENPDKVNLSERNATLCRIVDDDGKRTSICTCVCLVCAVF